MRALALACALMGTAGGVLADDGFVRNGMPCLDGICVGDDAADLAHIAWQPAPAPVAGTTLSAIRVSEPTLAKVREVLRGDDETIRLLAPYWTLHVLDGVALGALAGIRAVCEPIGVAGRLRATVADIDPQTRTVVSFEPVVPRTGAAPRFRVAAIVRYVLTEEPSRLRAWADDVARWYAGMPRYASASQPGVSWRPRSARGAQLRLLAPFGDPMERELLLRRHPACRGETGEASG